MRRCRSTWTCTLCQGLRPDVAAGHEESARAGAVGVETWYWVDQRGEKCSAGGSARCGDGQSRPRRAMDSVADRNSRSRGPKAGSRRCLAPTVPTDGSRREAGATEGLRTWGTLCPLCLSSPAPAHEPGPGHGRSPSSINSRTWRVTTHLPEQSPCSGPIAGRPLTGHGMGCPHLSDRRPAE